VLPKGDGTKARVGGEVSMVRRSSKTLQRNGEGKKWQKSESPSRENGIDGKRKAYEGDR